MVLAKKLYAKLPRKIKKMNIDSFLKMRHTKTGKISYIKKIMSFNNPVITEIKF